jgi:Flp pilus assembly protein TadG
MKREKRMAGLIKRLRDDERGISAVTVAICLIAIFGAAVLSVDAGSLWNTRRNIITGTDAAALDAARYFDQGYGDPCSAGGQSSAEADAKTVLLKNNANALHDPSATPNGYEVTTAVPCGTGGYIPGKVRFDGRLPGTQAFSGIFGFNKLSAISSSTAAWGYLSSMNGLRPIAMCDKSPSFSLWEQLHPATGPSLITQTQYDAFFGSNANVYPSSDAGWVNGASNDDPNSGKNYVDPRFSSGAGHHLISRITMPDAACGESPGNRIWVDFTPESGGGDNGASEIADQILNGYQGDVYLDPHDCNPKDSTTPQDCGGKSGNASSLTKALGDITCPVATQALNCSTIFAVPVVNSYVGPGRNIAYNQRAFLFVVLRGFGKLTSTQLQLDLEFVRIQGSGNISFSNPSADTTATGVELCGADHDTQLDRCGI